MLEKTTGAVAADSSGRTPSRSGADRATFRTLLRRTVEGEVLPRVLAQLRAQPQNGDACQETLPRLSAAALQHVMSLLASPDDGALLKHLTDLLDCGYLPEQLFDELIAPAARRMGTLWETDECNFVEVTLVCARLQRMAGTLGRMTEASASQTFRGRALVCGLASDQHTLGGIVIGEMLTRDGWLVTLAAPFAGAKPARSYDLACFSLASADQVTAAKRAIVGLRRRQDRELRVIVGGNAVLRYPDLVAEIGGDGWAEDAEGAVELARTFARHDEGRYSESMDG